MGSLCELICQSVRSSHDHKVVLRCPPSSRQGNQVVSVHEFNVEVGDYLLGDRQIAMGTSAPGAEGRKATTREGCAGAFTTEAKEGGAGREAGVGVGAVGGWACALEGVWAEGFLAAATLGGGLELLT